MITCEVCKRGFKRITATHLGQHGMTTTDYMARFPGSPMLDEAVAEAFTVKMTGRLGRSHSDEMKQRIREIKLDQYAMDPALRDRVSEGTRREMNRPETRARFDAYIAARDISGERNPFFGRHHTEEARRAIGENEERNGKIAAKKSEWWARHLGQIETPQLFPIGRVGRYKGHLFRSSWEYSFYKHLEAQGYDLQTQVVYEPIRVPYRFCERSRTYTPDFLLGPEKIIVEVKTTNELRRFDKRESNDIKFAAARRFCTEHGLSFRVMTEDDFPVLSYRVAFRDPNVVWIRGGPKQ